MPTERALITNKGHDYDEEEAYSDYQSQEQHHVNIPLHVKPKTKEQDSASRKSALSEIGQQRIESRQDNIIDALPNQDNTTLGDRSASEDEAMSMEAGTGNNFQRQKPNDADNKNSIWICQDDETSSAAISVSS